MKKKFWCVHHITVDKDGYMETICPCSSKEIAKKIVGSYSSGKSFIRYEEKEVAD